MTITTRHVIFGTGAIGLATLDALLRRWHHQTYKR
ncbi:MAG: hypothetical protein QOH97_1160 [Actinoplanes sp.]|jgi:hypothetical protein|nr:hypothetical protein [Actinoplanes sp.]